MKLIRSLGISARLFTCRRDERVAADGLDVTYSTESEQKNARVKDISPTGVYIFSNDRWTIGSTVPLTLKKWSVQEKNSEPSLRLYARAVRHGKDGMGFKFLYENVNTEAWLNVVEEAAPLIAERDAMRMLRVSRALAFLCRICPSQQTETLKLILDELIYENGEKALDILIGAEDLVSRRESATRTDVSSGLICRILFNGSRSSMKWVQHLWSGMLAAAALRDATDTMISQDMALLAKLNPVQLRIFVTSCTRGVLASSESGETLPRQLLCTVDEIQVITAERDLLKIEQDLDCLHQLALLEQTVKSHPFRPIEEANLTPTLAGLTLYAKCRGQLKPAIVHEPVNLLSLFAA